MHTEISQFRHFVCCIFVLVSSTSVAQTGEAIDDQALRDARADGEWLTYGGDYSETRYSPLAQITRDNVDRLRLIWSVEVPSQHNSQEGTPLVANGVLYGTTTWSVVFAIDLRTQELKWRWDPGVPRPPKSALPFDLGGAPLCCGPVNRGLAIYGDKIYVGIIDGRLAAVNIETGQPEWVVQTTPREQDVYSITGAPRVVKGNVIIGNGGAEFGARGFVTAYDAETGEKVWRFYTVPGEPGEPDGEVSDSVLEMAAETWTGEWWTMGGGGTAWDAFAYDPELDLLYVGVGNGSPWNRDKRSPEGGDNLFLASIVALRPDTGEYVWHYQVTPGDTWDSTATQNIVLADLEIDGQTRPVLMQAPKNGFFYVIDRTTGEFISAEAFGRVNWASGIDAAGRPIERPEARYQDPEVPVLLFPGPPGAHNWNPMSFNPETGLVYIPGLQSSFPFISDFSTPRGIAPGFGSEFEDIVEPPSIGTIAPDGQPGFLVAWDPVDQEEAWRVWFSTQFNSGTLTTAGNLVFHGTNSGVFEAYDAETGELRWDTELSRSIASPITYELDGQQYISVISGRDTFDASGTVWTFALRNRN